MGKVAAEQLRDMAMWDDAVALEGQLDSLTEYEALLPELMAAARRRLDNLLASLRSRLRTLAHAPSADVGALTSALADAEVTRAGASLPETGMARARMALLLEQVPHAAHHSLGAYHSDAVRTRRGRRATPRWSACSSATKPTRCQRAWAASGPTRGV